MGNIIVTGSCGFIGTALSLKLLKLGYNVVGIDNLSRPGSEINLRELDRFSEFTLHRVDLSNAIAVYDLIQGLDRIEALFHLSAQVAVTTSYNDPQKDFLNNAIASFNILEAIRRFAPETYCLYASTNKVYGKIDISDPVDEKRHIDPYTPYGVSKATGDMYFSEYGRKEIGLTTCVLRQSCIYGHHQFGIEDQGWIAWFAIANILGLPITIYGDGNQIRDLLYIDDLVDLYIELFENKQSGSFPIGGGVRNTISLKKSIEILPSFTKKKFPKIIYDSERPGDQPYFVADLSWLNKNNVKWRPKTDVNTGITNMVSWINSNADLIRNITKQ